ncbi:response regulator [Merismopedia glauca]|uniref:Multi-component transcriptional regulator n=1 Tax=Merismopedia glauca CCAP 1448/3 TaxID=1296344 RepID=A0A2T1C134_9CYAN|nr:response regulator [Merismopedia glauca]PSB01980.1 multi-component transcriptional regulator [Merismopedia glauca CCAP 1448/3]
MKILLVENDTLLGASLIKVLKVNHYAIDLAGDGQIGLDLATTVEYDSIVIDVQIPKLDGISLCRQLRSQGYRQPIVLLIGDDSDAVAIAGFDAGADDYICKPYVPEVLLARMRTLLRRSGAIAATISSQNSRATLTWGKLCLDLDSGRVTFGEQIIILTATEYKLLELLLRNPNRIFSRSAILDRLWGFDDAPTDRAINTHIKDLRKKLKAGGLSEEMIETVYGMGYRLKPAPQPPSQTEALSALARVSAEYRSALETQVTLLERAKTALLTGSLEPELRAAAKHEAHKLAGSLGLFGYPQGSKLARSIEHLLLSDRLFPPEDITRFSELVILLQQDIAKTPSTSLSSSTSASSSTHEVLAIDDDATLTERLKAEAEAWGFNLKIATNPAIARWRLAKSTPDVVLLDLSFPESEENGLTLLREISEQWADLPIIVFTSKDDLSDRLAASRLGARQFLHKSATIEQIFQAIRLVLPKPQPTAKILIVDDDPAMLALLSAMLTPWGLEIVTLSEPQHFWNVLVTTSPDLILLDLEMPQVSGLELCQVVRQDVKWGDVPILVVTAHTDTEALQQAFGVGADDFITKPVLEPELVTRILSRIERNRLQPRTENKSSTEENQ